jgi:Cd2+/Zn2+-exporting ATPase
MLAGNAAFLRSHAILFSDDQDVLATVHIAINSNYAGYITFTDELKPSALSSIKRLRSQGINKLGMLSGDKKEVVDSIASHLNLDFAHGELLPADKVNVFLKYRNEYPPSAFVGDGVNDAPVLASADIGIAMGAYGSETAIESADMVIEDDNLLKIPAAINIAQKTQKNVWQNLWFAAIVKVLVLVLGTIGIAGLGTAIFADVGVALLVVLNAYRLKNVKIDI